MEIVLTLAIQISEDVQILVRRRSGSKYECTMTTAAKVREMTPQARPCLSLLNSIANLHHPPSGV